jgi:hypothetical protein
MRKPAVFFLALFLPSFVVASDIPQGMNVGARFLSYDNSSMPFANLVDSASTFNWYRKTAPTPAYRPDGWPTVVNADTGTTQFFLGLNAVLPKGDYTVSAKGKGKVVFTGSFVGSDTNGNTTVVFDGTETPKKYTLANTGAPWGGAVYVTFVESSADDPVRDFKFYLPGQEGRKLNSEYLKDLKPFKVLRFMDWLATNGSTVTDWANRGKSGFSYTMKGRAEEETCVAVCNELDADFWYNIPAYASIQFCQDAAKAIDAILEKDRTIYVEYSNEVWNDYLPQKGQHEAMRTADKSPLGTWEYIAQRDGARTNAFKAALPASRKCVIVLARQTGYQATLTNAVAQYKTDGKKFDAISCNGYWDAAVDFNALTTLYATNPADATTKVIDGMDARQDEYLGYIAWWKARADEYKVPLVFYEAGQSLNNWLNEKSTPLILAVNRDARIKDKYLRFINKLPAGLALIVWYYDVGPFDKWGTWGHKERQGDPLEKSPKYAALMEAMPKAVEAPPDPVRLSILSLLKAMGKNAPAGYVDVLPDGTYRAMIYTDAPPGYRSVKVAPSTQP